MQELMNSNNEFTMTSLEVVDLINKLRKEEGNKVEKRHSDFMISIRKELEVLESLGCGNERNISLVKYKDSKGEVRPCYQLNRDGILMMLNKESTYVRIKTIEYLNALENKVKELSRPRDSYMIEDSLERAKRWMEEEKERRELKALVQEQEPYVEYAKSIEATNESISVGDFAKVLNKNGFNIGRTRLYNWLRENNILMSNNKPYQRYMDREYFEVIEYSYKTKEGEHLVFKTLITPKGQMYLVKKLIDKQD